jgi:hypothetical protein
MLVVVVVAVDVAVDDKVALFPYVFKIPGHA